MVHTIRWDNWPADTLYIWTNDNALPHLRQRIEERWEASEIEVISPEADEEMHFSILDDEHDRVLFVWWESVTAALKGEVCVWAPPQLCIALPLCSFGFIARHIRAY